RAPPGRGRTPGDPGARGPGSRRRCTRRAAPHRAPSRAGSRGRAPSRPGPRVARVLARPAALADLQRPERVDHDGQLVEELRARRPLDRTRLWAVGVAAGVQADRALADAG